MNITDEALRSIEDRFGWCSSWAIWADPDGTAKSGIEDISVFDFQKHPDHREIIHSRYFLVGLNVSGEINRGSFSNFHSDSKRSQDYKMRHAFRGTPLWGAYMTDILKNFPEMSSAKVREHVRNNPQTLKEQFENFQEEIDILCEEKPNIIAMGGLTYDLLRSGFANEYRLLRITHYSHYISPSMYRQEVHDRLGLEQAH
ncbi:hypothetical protein [Amaricoccus solimangrovi]|uniref:Uracil-DNA glycosylase-like domain-containing protein n=1 Tax=Amaricoccus solimangrovi TaxID=2589815 RepID=A0A501WV22_9RHOB|nr:hypothetical protein [Amaricoccus solimangrovi]TPE52592.1 hypothetical protein FJM51_05280 [Amaricoccus solimangrovi]